MGKQKIDRLLAQLKDNHSQDIQNAAAIFTVAQAAVNQLDPKDLPALPPAPTLLTKADLIERYGHYNGCRKAAKQAGIIFHQTPRWAQLIAAFSYLAACQACISAYVQQHPHPDLQGISLMLDLK
jgi:hypothetical protein